MGFIWLQSWTDIHASGKKIMIFISPESDNIQRKVIDIVQPLFSFETHANNKCSGLINIT